MSGRQGRKRRGRHLRWWEGEEEAGRVLGHKVGRIVIGARGASGMCG